MAKIKNYDRIYTELSQRRSEMTSKSLKGKIDRAIELTERSRQCLEDLLTERDILLASNPLDYSEKNEILDKAAIAIAENDRYEALLRSQLRMIKERKVTDFKVTEWESPTARKFASRFQEFENKSSKLMPKPDTIRKRIKQVRQNTELMIETTIGTIELGNATLMISKVIYAVSNLWMEYVLVNQIYDTSDDDFESTLRAEGRTYIISSLAQKILGIVPLVGIAVEFLDFVKNLAQIRTNRWGNADQTMLFLDNYENALSGWIHASEGRSTRASEFLNLIDS